MLPLSVCVGEGALLGWLLSVVENVGEPEFTAIAGE